MATQTSGGQSPKSFNRTIEESFNAARFTGVLNLNNRKLKDFPKVSKKYDLTDITCTDLSSNRLIEIPMEVCDLANLEELNCHCNILKCIPQAIIQLQSLVHLNLSRNQLSYIPDIIGQLKQLQVLLASNNRLVSMPEEISQLNNLMDLDISCNEITHLPQQMGEMEALRSLNVRNNLLVELPTEICKLKLQKLDLSDNRISTIPNEYCQMIDTLEDIRLQNNPLVSPPAKVCSKGRVHIMKYLAKEAYKEDRKQGVLNELDIKTNTKTGSLSHSLSDELSQYEVSMSDVRGKRRTIDSGYSTTDSSERSTTSHQNLYSADSEALPRAIRRLQTSFAVVGLGRSEDGPDSTTQWTHNKQVLSPHTAPPKSPRYVRGVTSPAIPCLHITSPDEFTRELEKQKTEYEERKRRADAMRQQLHTDNSPSNASRQQLHTDNSPSSAITKQLHTDASPSNAVRQQFHTETSPINAMRQQLHTETSPSNAIRQHLQTETSPSNAMRQHLQTDTSPSKAYDADREETRRAAIKLQEEQKAKLREQREQQNNNKHNIVSSSSPESGLVNNTMGNGHSKYTQQSVRKVQHSGSFKEERENSTTTSQRYYRRTLSESQFSSSSGDRSSFSSSTQEYSEPPVTPTTPTPDGVEYRHAPVAEEYSTSSQYSSPQCYVSPSQRDPPDHTSPPHTTDNSPHQSQVPEFRRRREALISAQRHEAQLTRRRLEEEKSRLRQRQKDAVTNYVAQQRGEHNNSSSDSSTFSFSHDGTPNTSFDAHSAPHNTEVIGTPPNYQKALDKLEAMSSELNSINPGFTVRRQLEQYVSTEDQISQLRKIIESRLRVRLPEDLPSALRDGVVLCHLANHIRPRAISSIHVPSQATPKLSMAKCRRNVENFLEACRQIGVREDYLCTPAAVLEANGIPYLTVTIHCLLNQAATPQQSTV